MMRKYFLILLTLIVMMNADAQVKQNMSPETLWKLGRLGSQNITPDGKHILFGVTQFNMAQNKSELNFFTVPVAGGPMRQITNEPGSKSILKIGTGNRVTYMFEGRVWQMNLDGENLTMLSANPMDDIDNVRLSPDGKKVIFSRDVDAEKILGKDKYSDLAKSNAYVFTDLNFRHWDRWNNGKCSHLFMADIDGGRITNEKDLMAGEPYDVPQKPSGGLEDMIFGPGGKTILYVCKKKTGKEYAQSTNTDIYQYDIASGKTTNLTEGMMGYDTNPAFSGDGIKLAWLSMKEDGYEADKNDIIIKDLKTGEKINLTENWDESVNGFMFSNDGSKLFFLAVHNGTEQLFQIDMHAKLGSADAIKQVTSGQWDISGIVAQAANTLIVNRTDMNHAAEIYAVNLYDGSMRQMTIINNDIYNRTRLSKIDERHIKTTDGKDMLAWVIYPPNFDPAKKYPTLLFCQGGPQSALSQGYSFRWNFQLMAAQGYIVIAPNRRGMPGHGVEWNREISGDWGGQPIKDYLSAIDDISKEAYVNKARLGCVGASYGGYSVYMLAGMHNKRFKTFIAHDGLFDLKSWYGTTEELWFANKDIGGNYWDKNNKAAKKSYEKFNPSNFVDKWDTPIMVIQGGKDFRVPIEQGLQAFQAAQLRGIKSKLLYLPEENHWVLKPQNALVWQREFYDWLKETL
jgi:dipeptidyl aminopeptidase/acylaminoacyl peptidase